MKIVTYNVNGLRPRVSSHGSLIKFLNSLEADIICLQETKLSRQELSADMTSAEGYEAFFSCTHASFKRRSGYSGVATFCKVNAAFSSTEVALPLAVEEGFTGLLKCPRVGETKATVSSISDYGEVQTLGCLTRQELLKLDSEGRCLITDHGHFVLFNIYGPCVQPGDSERFQFKLNFFKLLQRRWEALLGQGRRVFIVGDLNIAPFMIDSCHPGPDFEDNLCRKWLRTLLKNGGGPFIDAFRAFHPHRKEAYTCWEQSSGAEEFNFGTRIDLILVSGSCLHQDVESEKDHSIICHIEECDILTQFKRCNPDNAPRWHGGRSIKLEGSDHAPVYMKLREIPDIAVHHVPSLAVRYMPGVSGRQQSIVSLLQKRHATETEFSIISDLSSEKDSVAMNPGTQANPFGNVVVSPPAINSSESSLSSLSGGPTKFSEGRQGCQVLKKHFVSMSEETSLKSTWYECNKVMEKQTPLTQKSQTVQTTRNKGKKSVQCSLMSFFTVNSLKSSKYLPDTDVMKNNSCKIYEPWSKSDASHDIWEESCTKIKGDGLKECNPPADQSCIEHSKFNTTCYQENWKDDNGFTNSTQGEVKSFENLEPVISDEKEKAKIAALEWRKIQDTMNRSVPVCKGHGEPCVARVVKKAGPNIGRGFYVCARAKGPASNPEANCSYFEWSSSKEKGSGK